MRVRFCFGGGGRNGFRLIVRMRKNVRSNTDNKKDHCTIELHSIFVLETLTQSLASPFPGDFPIIPGQYDDEEGKRENKSG